MGGPMILRKHMLTFFVVGHKAAVTGSRRGGARFTVVHQFWFKVFRAPLATYLPVRERG